MQSSAANATQRSSLTRTEALAWRLVRTHHLSPEVLEFLECPLVAMDCNGRIQPKGSSSETYQLAKLLGPLLRSSLTENHKAADQGETLAAGMILCVQQLCKTNHLRKRQLAERLCLSCIMPVYLANAERKPRNSIAESLFLFREMVLLTQLETCLGNNIWFWLDEQGHIHYPRIRLDESFGLNFCSVTDLFFENLRSREPYENSETLRTLTPVESSKCDAYWELAGQWMSETKIIRVPPELSLGTIDWNKLIAHWNDLWEKLGALVEPVSQLALLNRQLNKSDHRLGPDASALRPDSSEPDSSEPDSSEPGTEASAFGSDSSEPWTEDIAFDSQSSEYSPSQTDDLRETNSEEPEAIVSQQQDESHLNAASNEQNSGARYQIDELLESVDRCDELLRQEALDESFLDADEIPISVNQPGQSVSREFEENPTMGESSGTPLPLKNAADEAKRAAVEHATSQKEPDVQQGEDETLSHKESTVTTPAGFVEIRDSKDPKLVDQLIGQLAQCRNRAGALSLIVVSPMEHSHCNNAASALDWQVEMLTFVRDDLDTPGIRGFISSDQTLTFVVEDSDRSEVTSLVRRAFVHIAQRESESLSTETLEFFAGIAAVHNPARTFVLEQLFDAAQRCLKAAERQGASAVKSLEVY